MVSQNATKERRGGEAPVAHPTAPLPRDVLTKVIRPAASFDRGAKRPPLSSRVGSHHVAPRSSAPKMITPRDDNHAKAEKGYSPVAGDATVGRSANDTASPSRSTRGVQLAPSNAVSFHVSDDGAISGNALFSGGSIKLLMGDGTGNVSLSTDSTPRGSRDICLARKNVHALMSLKQRAVCSTTGASTAASIWGRVMMASSALLAARVTDPHKWLLPLSRKDENLQKRGNDNTDGGTSLMNGGKHRCDNRESHNPLAFSVSEWELGTADELNESAPECPPLEARITLRHLRHIMRAFSSQEGSSWVCTIEAAKKMAVLPSQCDGDEVAMDTMSQCESRRSSHSYGAVRESEVGSAVPGIAMVAPATSKTSVLYTSQEGGLLGRKVTEAETTPVTGLMSEEAETNVSTLPDHLAAQEDAPSLMSTPPRMTATRGEVKTDGDTVDHCDVAFPQCHEAMEGSFIEEDRFYHPLLKTTTTTALKHLLERDALGRPTYTDAYDRKLTQKEFMMVMSHCGLEATHEELVDLLNKVDYDASGIITWNELATFLVSQSRHTADVLQSNFQFAETPLPKSRASLQRHHVITCFTTEPRRQLILTGGSEGTVRGWNSITLAYRGLLFSTKSWIAGVHYGSQARLLFIITMDREVFVLDANSYEVLRLYRGRAISETSAGMSYAYDTTRSVIVGGVALPQRRKARDRPTAESQFLGASPLECELSVQDGMSGESITGSGAYDALRYDSPSLTGPGNGPYVQRRLEEGVLTGLMDPVSTTLHHFTALDEECLLLGTAAGTVYMYMITVKSTKKVLLPAHVLHLHTKRINKLEFFFSMDALISCSDDGTVKLTSMVNGETLREFPSPIQESQPAIYDFAVYPQQKMLVTVGPGRSGLVWDFGQENPIMVLEAHNSPCRCCGICSEYDLIFTVGEDGSLHVYEAKSFRLLQAIDQDASAASRMVIMDTVRKRLVCFGKYPYVLRARRQATSTHPDTYQGHHAAMLNVFHTDAFDQIVTVDSECMAMTWKRATGENVFAFLLKDFSDSAVMNAARLTCVSLDELQRRLITGYQNGAVVVWNVVNGQPINFITAAMDRGSEGEDQSYDSAVKRQKETVLCQRPWRAGMSKYQHTSGENGAGDGKVGASGFSREITAVGSFVRHNATFFVFAVRDLLYSVRESSDFTVASASCWKVPEVYGEVLALAQVQPQTMICGTSSGALFFFNVISERQDGSVLWLDDSALESGGSAICFSSTHTIHHGMAPYLHSTNGLQRSGGRTTTCPPHVSSRVTKVMRLTAVSPSLLLSAHLDGTLGLWHTVRRLCLGHVNLASAGIDDGKENSGGVVVSVDRSNAFLAFSDDGGNVHVCRLGFKRLDHVKEGKPASGMVSPAPCNTASASNEEVSSALSPAFEHDDNEDTVKSNVAIHSPSSPLLEPRRPQVDVDDEERAGFSFQTFTRFSVFHSGLSSVTALLLVGPTDSLERCYAACRTQGTRPVNHFTSEEDGMSADGHHSPCTEPAIVCTGGDNYTRVFTLRGECIGELGMNRWVQDDPSTYQYMGKTPTKRLPSTIPSAEENPYYDFLEEASVSRQHSSLMLPKNYYRGRSQWMGVQQGILNEVTGCVLKSPRQCGSSPSAAPQPMKCSVGMPSGQMDSDVQRAFPLHQTDTQLAVALRATYASGTLRETFYVQHLDNGTAVMNGKQEAATVSPETQHTPLSSAPANQVISTLIRKSTRDRHAVTGHHRSIIKPNCSERVRHPALLDMSRASLTDGRRWSVGLPCSGTLPDAPIPVAASPSERFGHSNIFDQPSPRPSTAQYVHMRDEGGASSTTPFIMHHPTPASGATPPVVAAERIVVLPAPHCHDRSRIDLHALPQDGGGRPQPSLASLELSRPTNSSNAVHSTRWIEESGFVATQGTRAVTPSPLVRVESPHTTDIAPSRERCTPSTPISRIGYRDARPVSTTGARVRRSLCDSARGEHIVECVNGDSALRRPLLTQSADSAVCASAVISHSLPKGPGHLAPGVAPRKRCYFLPSTTGVLQGDLTGADDTDYLSFQSPKRMQSIGGEVLAEDAFTHSQSTDPQWRSKVALSALRHGFSDVREPVLKGDDPMSPFAGGSLTVGAAVQQLLQRRTKQKNNGAAGLSHGARSYIAQVSARMYIAPIVEIEPPVGSRLHEDAKAWKAHLQRLHCEKNTNDSLAARR